MTTNDYMNAFEDGVTGYSVNRNPIKGLIEAEIAYCREMAQPSPVVAPPEESPCPFGLNYPDSIVEFPSRNEDLINSVLWRNEDVLETLITRSPFPCAELSTSSARAIALLHSPHALLCVSEHGGDCYTLPCGEFLAEIGRNEAVDPWLLIQNEVANINQLVASPMLSYFGRDGDSKFSPLTADNAGPRHYLVVRLNGEDSLDDKAAHALYLGAGAPLVMVVLSSDQKNLDCWFWCRGADPVSILRFFRVAVMLGADAATWNPLTMVNLPGCYDTHERNFHEVIYAQLPEYAIPFVD